MSKLFPFWWLLPPEVVQLEEGNFSDYSVYDSFDDTEQYAGDWENAALFNEGDTVALLIDENVCIRFSFGSSR